MQRLPGATFANEPEPESACAWASPLTFRVQDFLVEDRLIS